MHAYSGKDSRARVYALLATVSVVVAIIVNAITDAIGLRPAWLFSSPTVGATYYFLYRLLDSRAWKWDLLRKTGFVDTPVVAGTYEGHLVSSYGADKIPIKLTISQSWTGIFIRMEVLNKETSKSRSVTASLDLEGHDGAHLTYAYKNEIQPGIADDDVTDHDGTADLDVNLADRKISGRYYNARGRQGNLRLTPQP